MLLFEKKLIDKSGYRVGKHKDPFAQIINEISAKRNEQHKVKCQENRLPVCIRDLLHLFRERALNRLIAVNNGQEQHDHIVGDESEYPSAVVDLPHKERNERDRGKAQDDNGGLMNRIPVNRFHKIQTLNKQRNEA